jgi:hypothetical protein
MAQAQLALVETRQLTKEEAKTIVDEMYNDIVEMQAAMNEQLRMYDGDSEFSEANRNIFQNALSEIWAKQKNLMRFVRSQRMSEILTKEPE